MIKIEIDEEGNLNGTGKMKIKHLNQSDFTEIFHDCLACHKQLGIAYETYIADDQKLVGQEKASMMAHIENMFLSLTTLRLYLEKNYLESNLISVHNAEEKFDYTLHLENFDFTLRGKISIAHYNEISTFRDWYRESFTGKLNLFLKDLKAALADKVLNKQEVSWLNNRLDSMIHSLIVIFFKLERARMPV